MKSVAINLAQATPGMCLGADVQDAHGAVLLAQGTELTESLLAALLRRGIERIEVLETDAPDAADFEARREAVEARLAHLFRRAGESDADRQLFHCVRGYRLESMQ